MRSNSIPSKTIWDDLYFTKPLLYSEGADYLQGYLLSNKDSLYIHLIYEMLDVVNHLLMVHLEKRK